MTTLLAAHPTWFILIAIACGLAALGWYAACLKAGLWIYDRWQARTGQQAVLAGHLHAEAERIVPAAPITADELGALIKAADECNDPPCEPEDGWVCGWHLYHVRQAGQPDLPGRHRLGNTPLDDMPASVIARVITDLNDKKGRQQ